MLVALEWKKRKKCTKCQFAFDATPFERVLHILSNGEVLLDENIFLVAIHSCLSFNGVTNWQVDGILNLIWWLKRTIFFSYFPSYVRCFCLFFNSPLLDIHTLVGVFKDSNKKTHTNQLQMTDYFAADFHRPQHEKCDDKWITKEKKKKNENNNVTYPI